MLMTSFKEPAMEEKEFQMAFLIDAAEQVVREHDKMKQDCTYIEYLRKALSELRKAISQSK